MPIVFILCLHECAILTNLSVVLFILLDEPNNNTQEHAIKKKLEFPMNGMTNNSIMKQLSRNAFNGTYEIGIQRKIKPGDHIANMANKIKETVVLKHPMQNSNDLPISTTNEAVKFSKFSNGINSTNSLNSRTDSSNARSTFLNQSHPVPITPQAIIGNMSGNIPPPPPPPKFKVGSLSPVQSSLSPVQPSHASPPSLSQSSSPMTSLSESGSLSPVYERQYHNNDISDIPPRQLTSALLNKLIKKDLDNGKFDTDKKKLPFPKDHHIHSNLYQTNTNGQIKKPIVEPFKPSINNEFINKMVKHHTNLESDSPKSTVISNVEKFHNTEKKIISNESPVKLRDKKKTESNDQCSGKRDSHVVSRPLSTIASMDVDVVDGVYPICNDCNKQITR